MGRLRPRERPRGSAREKPGPRPCPPRCVVLVPGAGLLVVLATAPQGALRVFLLTRPRPPSLLGDGTPQFALDFPRFGSESPTPGNQLSPPRPGRPVTPILWSECCCPRDPRRDGCEHFARTECTPASALKLHRWCTPAPLPRHEPPFAGARALSRRPGAPPLYPRRMPPSQSCASFQTGRMRHPPFTGGVRRHAGAPATGARVQPALAVPKTPPCTRTPTPDGDGGKQGPSGVQVPISRSPISRGHSEVECRCDEDASSSHALGLASTVPWVPTWGPQVTGRERR